MALPPPTPGSTCLVTGASSGIGVELARELARRGHGVTLVARREDRLSQLAGELERDHGIRAEPLAADLSDPQEWERVSAVMAERGLLVEVLANNAGVGRVGSFHKLDLGAELAGVRLNCEAVVALSGTYLPGMIERGRGAILNIASTAGFQPMPSHAVYAATKAFVLSFSEALHAELKGSGVTVTAVCPGPVHSEFAKLAGTQEELSRSGPLALSAADCASASIRALERGQRVVVPGLAMKVLMTASRPIPTTVKLPLLRRFWRRHA